MTEQDPRCSRPRKRHSPNCDCATVTDEKLIRDLESMLSIIDHASHPWVTQLVAPLVTGDRKRAKALYRRYIGMVDTGPRLPPPSQRCGMCRYEPIVCRKCKCCDGCCEHRRTKRQKALRAAAAKTQMLKDFAQKHKVMIVTAIQGTPLTAKSLFGSIIAPRAEAAKPICLPPDPRYPEANKVFSHTGTGKVAPGEGAFIMMETAGIDKRTPARELYRKLMAIRQRMLSRHKPKQIEIEGIWSDGEVTSKVLATDGITCSTGVAISYIRGQRHPACKAKLWLVRFLNDGRLVREWDEINQKYHLEID